MKKMLLSTLFVGLAFAANAENLRYFGQTADSYRSRIAYGNNAETGRYAVSDGTKIYYESYGQGEPVVVLHGGLVGSIGEMGQFIDELAKSRRVIAVSTRGHGRSEAGKAAPTYAQKAADIAAVLKKERIEKADFLGFSDGAYTALTFAARQPEQTGKVVAIGAGEWKKGFVQGGGSKRASFEQIRNMDEAYWQAQQAVRPEPNNTAAWFAAANRTYDETAVGKETFANIRTPVLYVVGEDDANAPLDTVIAAYKMTPNADLSVIPNAPHPVFMANFPAVWAVVEPFLKK